MLGLLDHGGGIVRGIQASDVSAGRRIEKYLYRTTSALAPLDPGISVVCGLFIGGYLTKH